MFDGAGVATLSTVAIEPLAQSQAEALSSPEDVTADDALPDPAPTGEPQFSSSDQALFDALAAYDTSAARQEIVFLSPSVRDYQQLLDGISPNVEVIILDPARDGVQQMAETLAGRTGIDAIHLIGEGTEAEMHLGASFLTQESISTRYAEQFQQIGQSLSGDADVLIYGCNFGRGPGGLSAIQTLADLTGADIAASTDRTGHISEYANWQLEISTGFIESSIVIGQATQETWEGVLATYTVTNTNDAGAGSLRQAIINANVDAGTDTIDFNIAGAGPHTITLTSALLDPILYPVLIDGWSQTGFAGTPLIRIDGASAPNGAGLSFSGTSDGSTVRGLMITGFKGATVGDGILVQTGADNITIRGNWIGTTGTGSTGVGNADDGIDVRGSGAIIGGTGTNDRNVITNNVDEGITIVGSGVTGHLIQGNIIGLDPDGSTNNGLGDVGIAIISGTGNTIGGTTAAARNVISRMVEGIEINTSNNIVQGNYIGTDATGTLNRGNRSSDGVEIQGSSTGNVIGGEALGAGNIIAFNAQNGVDVVNGSNNAIVRNSIHSNTLLGINLGAAGVTANDSGDGDTGANNLQNFPVLTTAVTTGTQITVTGTLNSTASTSFRIEFYSNATGDGTGYGEGQTLIGISDVTTNGSGNASFSPTFTATVSVGSAISATVSKLDLGDSPIETSEFAQNVTATNTAPVLDASKSPALTAINEDAGAPSGVVGTLVSQLVDFTSPAGQVDNVTDPDAGALLGIAITAADTTNGTWFYSTNNGASWNALGAVATNNARLLAADANTRLYFQPNADYNGTLTNAITFRAWDQSSGTNGSLAAITTTTETVLDTFTVSSYSNNNGTQNWTTNWIENDTAGGGAGGGNIDLPSPYLRFRPINVGDWLYRQANLSGATSATLSFDVILNAMVDSGVIAVQVSSNGGANYTTLTAITNATVTGTKSFDISSYAAANTQIRFYASVASANGIRIDDLQISYSVVGGGTTAFSSATDTASLVVNAVNDAPTITNLAGDSLAYNEGDGAVVIEQGANAVVADVDSTDFNTGTLTVSFTAGSDSAEDVLAIRNQGTGAGQIGVSGANVTYQGVTIGTFTGGSSGTNLVITLNSSATPTAVT
ncbi:MAG: DUF4347 domain-containing protein, partial [Nitrospira sp.]|nr:DUF4347 domain-containing protein [Nitrospira sp.]